MIEPVVELDQLSGRPGSVVLADVRFYLDGRSGREAYERGHLPGAVFVDLGHDLAEPASPAGGRHPLPDPVVFAERMASLGLSDHDTVIAYDDAGGVMAARLVWMLRATGREAALLNGGFAAYDGKLETTAPNRPRGTFAARPWPPERLATLDEVAGNKAAGDKGAGDEAAGDTVAGDEAAGDKVAGGGAVLIDARPPERFRGETEPLDPRPGHIPGARSVPCRDNVDASGRFLAADQLRKRFAAAGVTDDADVISYCGSGVTACHNLLALEVAGFPPGRLYPGSWSQYSHTDRPAQLGD